MNELWNHSDPTSPTYRQRLHTYLTNSLAQAQDGAQATEDLAHTEAAQLAQKARRTASYWSVHVQKGGVLYVPKARNIAAIRVEDELAKAKALVDKAAVTRRGQGWCISG